jgi:hypothetical protein
MENRIDILNELQALSPAIAALEKVNVFTVPDGYFEYLSADVLTGIHAEYGLDSTAANNSSAEVPVGYFESLAGSVLAKIKAQDNEDAVTEIRALSPMLYSIQNENVFTVPKGYFENLSVDILDRVIARPKVVTMQRRSSVFVKYAVAAAFTGVMALGIFKFTGADKPAALPAYVTAGLKVQDVDQELAKISDDDIVKYLEASGTDVKTAMVANSIDENELPAQEDYLLDEKALDKYLNSINVNDLKN